MKKLTSLLAVLLILCLSAPSCFAAGHYQTRTFNLGGITCDSYLEMWHYSGGYWKVGNDCDTAIKITDRELGNAANIQGYLQSNQYATFRVRFPDYWLEKLKPGDSFSFSPSSSSILLKYLFDTNSFTGYFESPYYYIQAKPRFNLDSGYSFDDFVSGLRTTIPLIDSKYGENLYAIYKGPSPCGAGSGWFSASSPYSISQPHIHPSMISDSSGAFKSGYKINNLISNFGSAGYSVGNGTFRGGGAVGLKFYFKVNALFKVTRTEWVEDAPSTPPSSSGSGSGSGSGGTGGSSGGSPGGSSGGSPGGSSGGSPAPSPSTPSVPDPPPTPPFEAEKWRIHRLK